MKTTAITYRELFDQLRALGFIQRKASYQGVPQWIFTHKDRASAIILLPEAAPTEKVQPLHRAAVRAVLDANGIGTANGQPALRKEQVVLCGSSVSG